LISGAFPQLSNGDLVAPPSFFIPDHNLFLHLTVGGFFNNFCSFALEVEPKLSPAGLIPFPILALLCFLFLIHGTHLLNTCQVLEGFFDFLLKPLVFCFAFPLVFYGPIFPFPLYVLSVILAIRFVSIVTCCLLSWFLAIRIAFSPPKVSPSNIKCALCNLCSRESRHLPSTFFLHRVPSLPFLL